MRTLILISMLLAGCDSWDERARSLSSSQGAYSIKACQDACRSAGAPNWGFAIGTGHFSGCMCIGPVPPAVPQCPPRPVDGGCQ